MCHQTQKKLFFKLSYWNDKLAISILPVLFWRGRYECSVNAEQKPICPIIDGRCSTDVTQETLTVIS